MKVSKLFWFLLWILIALIIAAGWIITEAGRFFLKAFRKLGLLIYYDLFPEMQQDYISFNSEEYEDVVYNIGEDYDRLTS